MTENEKTLTGALQGTLLTPEDRTGLGVVVLHGSSGRPDVTRTRLFAAKGAVALAMRWFGGEGQSPTIHQIPLETFIRATDKLIELGCSRIAFIGTSRGAEAALLTAIEDPRIDVVIAISPSSVAWQGDGWPPASSWTRNGAPLPFVHYDVEHLPKAGPDGLIAYRKYFELSLARFGDEIPAASILIEKTRARVILVAGGDDALWLSDRFARSLSDRLAAARKSPILVMHPKAGHRVLLPGENTPRSTINAHGGNDEADRALGSAAWVAISEVLRFPV